MGGRSASTVEQRWTLTYLKGKVKNSLPLTMIKIGAMAMPGEVQAAPWAVPGELALTGRMRYASALTTHQYRWLTSLRMGHHCRTSRG